MLRDLATKAVSAASGSIEPYLRAVQIHLRADIFCRRDYCIFGSVAIYQLHLEHVVLRGLGAFTMG